jgi:hypothetical protein
MNSVGGRLPQAFSSGIAISRTKRALGIRQTIINGPFKIY